MPARQEGGQKAADQASSAADDALKRLNEATDGAAQQVVDAVREKVLVQPVYNPYRKPMLAVTLDLPYHCRKLNPFYVCTVTFKCSAWRCGQQS